MLRGVPGPVNTEMNEYMIPALEEKSYILKNIVKNPGCHVRFLIKSHGGTRDGVVSSFWASGKTSYKRWPNVGKIKSKLLPSLPAPVGSVAACLTLSSSHASLVLTGHWSHGTSFSFRNTLHLDLSNMVAISYLWLLNIWIKASRGWVMLYMWNIYQIWII